MLLVEGAHYIRKDEEFIPMPQPAKRYLDCVLCDRSDSTAPWNKRKSKKWGKWYRLDMLMAHCQSVHTDALIDEGSRTLIDMDFTRASAAASGSNEAATAGQDLTRPDYFAHGNGPTIKQAPTRWILTFVATVEGGGDLDGHQLWRVSRQQVDGRHHKGEFGSYGDSFFGGYCKASLETTPSWNFATKWDIQDSGECERPH